MRRKWENLKAQFSDTRKLTRLKQEPYILAPDAGPRL